MIASEREREKAKHGKWLKNQQKFDSERDANIKLKICCNDNQNYNSNSEQ